LDKSFETEKEKQRRVVAADCGAKLMLAGYPHYKDSGLPWMPEIPDDWQVLRNGRLFGQRLETGYPDLPILEVSLRTGVRVRDMENDKRKQVMNHEPEGRL